MKHAWNRRWRGERRRTGRRPSADRRVWRPESVFSPWDFVEGARPIEALEDGPGSLHDRPIEFGVMRDHDRPRSATNASTAAGSMGGRVHFIGDAVNAEISGGIGAGRRSALNVSMTRKTSPSANIETSTSPARSLRLCRDRGRSFHSRNDADLRLLAGIRGKGFARLQPSQHSEIRRLFEHTRDIFEELNGRHRKLLSIGLTPIGLRATANGAVWRRLKITSVGVVGIMNARSAGKPLGARNVGATRSAPTMSLEACGKLSEAETPRRYLATPSGAASSELSARPIHHAGFLIGRALSWLDAAPDGVAD